MVSYTSAQTIVVYSWRLPICQMTDDRDVRVANPKVPTNTAAAPVALAKREPGKLACSSAGIGGGNRLADAPDRRATGRSNPPSKSTSLLPPAPVGDTGFAFPL